MIEVRRAAFVLALCVGALLFSEATRLVDALNTPQERQQVVAAQ
ncbi:hypothetical protein Q3Y58_10300 [Pseudovibrio sp. SPO723]|nr:hypothetical protein [Pseudovibrio sp. SPO723]